MSENILVTLPSFSEDAKQYLEGLGDVKYETPSQEDLEKEIDQYSILVIGLDHVYKKETIEKATNLKAIATATTGLDHIDTDYAKERGIEILSLKGEQEFLDTITGTAELAFGLMIELLRMTPHAYNAVVDKGEWRREDYRGQSLYGKTLGIIGIGRLGKIMAKGAHGFRMNVVFSDPNVEQDAFPEYKKVTQEELLVESDVVALHVHLTPETENMISTNEFKQMKNSAVLINTARGKIVDEDALVEALEAGELKGYATDVLSDELEFGEDASSDKLVQYAQKNSNVIIVPHIGGMTADSRVATDVFMVKKVKTYIQT